MKILKKIFYIVALLVFLLLTLGPFVWMFIISITPQSEILSANSNFLPDSISFRTYQELFGGSKRSVAYFNSMKNSLKAVFITIFIGLPISFLSAYVLTKMKFKGRGFIKNLLLITMVIPVMATIIPLYRMYSMGGFLDQSFWLALVYVSAYLPMAIWMIGNYLSTIPRDVEEAAMLDGCSRMDIFFKVILPLSYPILFSVTLIMFLNTWSQFQIPLILASSVQTKPLAIVVSEFVTKDSVEYSLIASAGMVALLPPAVTAFVFRKYLISGLMKGSSK